MALLPKQTVASVDAGGTVITQSAVSASDTFAAAAGRTRLTVRNGSGASINVTFTVRVAAQPGLVPTNKVQAVAAGAVREFLVDETWINPADGLVTVAFSATATITAEVRD